MAIPILNNIPININQGISYSLPGPGLINSTSPIQGSNDEITWVDILGANTIGVFISYSFIRCIVGTSTVSMRVSVGGTGGLTVGVTTIAGGTTQDVLYNNGGVLGAASGLTVNLTGFVSAALEIARTVNVDDDNIFLSASVASSTIPNAAHPFAESYGLAVYNSIPTGNTADLGALYGITTFVNPDGAAGADYTAVAAYYGTISTSANGANIPGVYGFFIDWAKGAPGAGTWSTSYSFYSVDMASKATATNMYYVWFDSRGVYRIRDDNTFDSVYQAISALYNPQFAKYTPGAANYERIVQQWESNKATIRTEAGGTGTLRDIQIAGQNVVLSAVGGITTPNSLLINNATGIPAGGTAGVGYKFSSVSNYGIFFGSGAPTLSAAKGSLYLRSDGSGTTNRAYINTDGSTAWTAITTSA